MAAVRPAARRIAERWVRRGTDTGHTLGFDTGVLVAAMDRQTELEATAGPGSSLLEVTEPTETAVAAAFAHTALLAGRPANEAPLREIGQLFGRVAHLLDAVEDYYDDLAHGKWNPLVATGTPVADVRALCDDAVLGIELALADVEFTDDRLPRRLLTNELRRSVSRTFTGAFPKANFPRDPGGTPHGQQDGINFGNQPFGDYPGAPGEMPHRRDATRAAAQTELLGLLQRRLLLLRVRLLLRRLRRGLLLRGLRETAAMRVRPAAPACRACDRHGAPPPDPYVRMGKCLRLSSSSRWSFTVLVGTLLGQRYRVGPPVLLIFLGALLGLIPRFGGIHIDGELVLLLFLPAILYWESLNTSFREMKANMRVIVMTSIGLVIATAVAVSATARALGMESHAAAVLGAVLSPTDAAAVAGLAKKLPRRALTVLRGESLINDGTALVLFGVTVSVAVGGNAVGPLALTGRFVYSYLGGIAAGLLVGGLVTLLRRRIDSPLEEGALSLLTPFAAFLLAQSFDCSGVVAVLVSALVITYVSPKVIRARSRLQSFALLGHHDVPDQRLAVGVRRRPASRRPARHRRHRWRDPARHLLGPCRHRRRHPDPVRLGGNHHRAGPRHRQSFRQRVPRGRLPAAQRHQLGRVPRRGVVGRSAGRAAGNAQRRALPGPQPDHLRRLGGDPGDRSRPRQHAARRGSVGAVARRRRPRRRSATGPHDRRRGRAGGTAGDRGRSRSRPEDPGPAEEGIRGTRPDHRSQRRRIHRQPRDREGRSDSRRCGFASWTASARPSPRYATNA